MDINFGYFFSFDSSQVVSIVFLFYCDFKQEYWLRGSFLVYTHTFKKYFSTELSFKSSTSFLFISPEQIFTRAIGCFCQYNSMIVSWAFLFFTANFTLNYYVGCFVKSLEIPWSQLDHLNSICFTAFLWLFVTICSSVKPFKLYMFYGNFVALCYCMFLKQSQCALVISARKLHEVKPRISQGSFD